jgi:hypothetical protein
MRTTFLVAITIMLLGSCSKTKYPINFNCKVADTYINNNVPTLISGNANTFYNPSLYTFQITMSGPGSQQVALVWYNVDSLNGIKALTAKTYTINPFQYNTPTLVGSYEAQNSSGTYVTGGASNLAGTVTITSNTGPGGAISGTFTFNALNSAQGDTVYITQGSFTNLSIQSN